MFKELLQIGMLERTYEPKRHAKTGWGKKSIMTFMKYTSHKKNFKDTKLMMISWGDKYNSSKRREKSTIFYSKT
jgi:hypothetical protein